MPNPSGRYIPYAIEDADVVKSALEQVAVRISRGSTEWNAVNMTAVHFGLSRAYLEKLWKKRKRWVKKPPPIEPLPLRCLYCGQTAGEPPGSGPLMRAYDWRRQIAWVHSTCASWEMVVAGKLPQFSS